MHEMRTHMALGFQGHHHEAAAMHRRPYGTTREIDPRGGETRGMAPGKQDDAPFGIQLHHGQVALRAVLAERQHSLERKQGAQGIQQGVPQASIYGMRVACSPRRDNIERSSTRFLWLGQRYRFTKGYCGSARSQITSTTWVSRSEKSVHLAYVHAFFETGFEKPLR